MIIEVCNDFVQCFLSRCNNCNIKIMKTTIGKIVVLFEHENLKTKEKPAKLSDE